MTQLVIGLVVGLLVGVGVVYYILHHRQASDAETAATVEQLKGAFASLSQAALQANSEQVVRLAQGILSEQTAAAKKELETDKKLIDQNLDVISRRLNELQVFVQKADTAREGSHRALSAQLQAAAQETTKLRQTAEQLSTALASPQHRGQWGERMAEDVLHLAGFIENVNYYKQKRLDQGPARPDFTFPLPNGLKLNMDVKFPLANYLRYLESKTDDERARLAKAFIADVRGRIREAASRDYINPAEGTVDYALVFIPNEQVYGALYELDSSLIDEALRQKIVLCSPLTLYAVLAVIRQAAQHFAMERKAFEMAGLINAFLKQWSAFKDELEKLGTQLDTVQKTYGRIITTRANQLEKPIEKIEQLRAGQGPELTDDSGKPCNELENPQ